MPYVLAQPEGDKLCHKQIDMGSYLSVS
jgi:hypothetical protein